MNKFCQVRMVVNIILVINMTERKLDVDENFNVWEIQPTRETTTSSSMIKEDLEEVTANGLSVVEEMGIKITPKKRFDIVKSKLVENAHVIEDGKKQFTFPTLVGDNRGLIAYKEALNKLSEENEQLKKEKKFWKGDACNCSNYLSILSMDCQIVQEAIYDLKNVIDVDTEASKLLDKLDDKFDELNQHRIKMYSR